VLVADDVAMNRDVVGGMLDSLGCIVVEVTAADRTRDLRPAC
jgi:CheY-like chemotaxis protein